MAEWSKAVDSKSIVRSRVPGVRIPLSPPPSVSLHSVKIHYNLSTMGHMLLWCVTVVHLGPFKSVLLQRSSVGTIVGTEMYMTVYLILESTFYYFLRY